MDEADGQSDGFCQVSAPKLVIGANGYLGSHVTRQLVDDGHDVRVMVRDGANTIGIDDLKVTRFVGDIWNDDVLRAAMAGCDDVYYCVVDTRAWLRDTAPLFRTNVEGLQHVLDGAGVPRQHEQAGSQEPQRHHDDAADAWPDAEHPQGLAGRLWHICFRLLPFRFTNFKF